MNNSMGYPTPPLSNGLRSPKQTSFPAYSSQLVAKPYFPPYEAEHPRSYDAASEYQTYYAEPYDQTYRSIRDRSASPPPQRLYPVDQTYRSIKNRSASPPQRLYPVHRVPSSYHASSRPRPRPGLVKRVLGKFRQWMRDMLWYARKHPIKTGLMTIFPALAVGGVVKGLVSAGQGLMKFLSEDKRKDRKRRGEEKDDPMAIFGQFKKFGNTKGGPLDGVLKIFQMFINHWCRLTPSNFPRVISIMMELYFLEPWKL
ncbi:hypothetical protein PVAG01_03807 [Phlyctema vagabunda]|uniref:Uncharacterized protein n=1 Tax=Phlyctema vagabunda TaxID=108571 RepID=A0ABR4PMG5_9HELO